MTAFWIGLFLFTCGFVAGVIAAALAFAAARDRRWDPVGGDR